MRPGGAAVAPPSSVQDVLRVRRPAALRARFLAHSVTRAGSGGTGPPGGHHLDAPAPFVTQRNSIMNLNPTDEAVGAEVLALRATVRALARVHGRRSPAALHELVQALAEETGRLSETLPSFDTTGREAANRASRLLAELVAELTDEARAA